MTSVLVALLLAAHLICMNVASAGPLVGIWLDRAAARSLSPAERAGPWLAWKSLQLAAVGALLGLTLGWLQWDDTFATVLRQFSARIYWGIAEFAFSLLILAGYAAWCSAKPRTNNLSRWARSMLALLSSTNLLYHFPPLFTLIANASAGRIERGPVNSAVFRRLIVRGEVLALTTHFALASIAVTGMALLVFAWMEARRDDANEPDRVAEIHRVAIWGGRIALVATLLQIPAGLWLLVALPSSNQQQLLGGDWVGSVLFVVSMVILLGLLHQLAAVAFGDTTRQALRRAIHSMVLVVVAMSGVLQRLNQ